MAQIHLPTSSYSAPGTISGWQWLPFTDTNKLNTLQRAINIINSKIKNYKPCNDSFKALPGGKTFLQTWYSPSVWISYDPDQSGNKWGACYNKKDITISAYALAMGHWSVAATLVHELAHVNGAHGHNTQAEDTLLSCLLNTLHDPTIIGKIIRSKKFTRIS